MTWWFLLLGIGLVGMGITQAIVGTDRIVGPRWTFEDFSIRGRPIAPRRVVLWLAVTEIAAGLGALAVAATAA